MRRGEGSATCFNRRGSHLGFQHVLLAYILSQRNFSLSDVNVFSARPQPCLISNMDCADSFAILVLSLFKFMILLTGRPDPDVSFDIHRVRNLEDSCYIDP